MPIDIIKMFLAEKQSITSAKCIEMQEISLKTAKLSLSSMPKYVQLLEISLKNLEISQLNGKIAEYLLYNSNIFSMTPRFLSS
jgi:hypothetical protein